MKRLMPILMFILCMPSLAIAIELTKAEAIKQKNVTKLKEELDKLEGSILYKRCCSPFNIIRERTAFALAIAGIAGSFVAPFKLVKSNPRHPVKTFTQRVGVSTAALTITVTAAFVLSYSRPVLWWHEYKRDGIKTKLYELQKQS